MEVRAVTLGGCALLIFGVMSLGIAPLAIWWSMRRWPNWVDDQGLRLRSGAQIGWQQVTRVVKVISDVNGTVVTRYDLHSKIGVIRVVPDRLHGGDEVLGFILQRVPPSALLDG
jgi:uncharacterized Tic20 family protein